MPSARHWKRSANCRSMDCSRSRDQWRRCARPDYFPMAEVVAQQSGIGAPVTGIVHGDQVHGRGIRSKISRPRAAIIRPAAARAGNGAREYIRVEQNANHAAATAAADVPDAIAPVCSDRPRPDQPGAGHVDGAAGTTAAARPRPAQAIGREHTPSTCRTPVRSQLRTAPPPYAASGNWRATPRRHRCRQRYRAVESIVASSACTVALSKRISAIAAMPAAAAGIIWRRHRGTKSVADVTRVGARCQCHPHSRSLDTF